MLYKPNTTSFFYRRSAQLTEADRQLLDKMPELPVQPRLVFELPPELAKVMPLLSEAAVEYMLDDMQSAAAYYEISPKLDWSEQNAES